MLPDRRARRVFRRWRHRPCRGRCRSRIQAECPRWRSDPAMFGAGPAAPRSVASIGVHRPGSRLQKRLGASRRNRSRRSPWRCAHPKRAVDHGRRQAADHGHRSTTRHLRAGMAGHFGPIREHGDGLDRAVAGNLGGAKRVGAPGSGGQGACAKPGTNLHHHSPFPVPTGTRDTVLERCGAIVTPAGYEMATTPYLALHRPAIPLTPSGEIVTSDMTRGRDGRCDRRRP